MQIIPVITKKNIKDSLYGIQFWISATKTIKHPVPIDRIITFINFCEGNDFSNILSVYNKSKRYQVHRIASSETAEFSFQDGYALQIARWFAPDF